MNQKTFHARNKEIVDDDAPSEVVEERNRVSDREFARRAIAELIGIRHEHARLIARADVLQEEIRRRILKIEAPAKAPDAPKKRSKR